MPELWEKQPEETDEEFEAFRAYRDMTAPRKLRFLVRPSNNIFYPIALTRRWFHDGAWEIRVNAWTKHLDSLILSERVEAQRVDAVEIAEEHRALLAKSRALAHAEIAKLLARAEIDGGLGLLKPAETIKLLEVTVKLDRLVNGESTENVQTDYSNLSLEELRVLEELERKAKEKAGESEDAGSELH